MMKTTKPLFSYRPYWAKRFGTASILPMSKTEMDQLGWDSCDIILVTGDAYVDHPSFGAALIGRLLEAQGFRVGIISQPNWNSTKDFKKLGIPNLFFGITSGNMDSMVNRYTADRKIRSDDAYSPNAEPNRRPDRSVIVYAQRCREAYKETPIILGGIEASLRRAAHYDYWSEKIRHSILLDSKADILIYGNGERAVVELAHRLAKDKSISQINDIRGTAISLNNTPENSIEIDKTSLETKTTIHNGDNQENIVIRIPSYEQVCDDPLLFAHASRILHAESLAGNARALLQADGKRYIQMNPPPIPLTTEELDKLYELPFSRKPHPVYGNANIPAYEMIRFSVTITRGCFGGCTFCSIGKHEGRVIQNRSEASILREIEEIRDHTPGFTGIISDLGGPTANMYRMHCRDESIQQKCRRFSCLYPTICKNLNTNHVPLINLYKKARELPGIKKVLIGSGVRYDLANESPEYIKELVTHHVGGYLKIAPEHVSKNVLNKMMKPDVKTYDRFKQLFDKYSALAGKEQYLIPYFIAAHPGCTNEDMLEVALWLKKNKFRLDKVQTFLPTPMTLATVMYHSKKDVTHKLEKDEPNIFIPFGANIRKLHKAFLRYHDPKNWPLLRKALKEIGREDLIGRGKQYLVPK